MKRYHPLDEKESAVILHKGTERPFSGAYDHLFVAGVYVCRQCDFPLFLSQDKFNSGCGWPSFDDCIPDHVKITLDADGIREEILCARCHGHLGHVFIGEKLTPKNTRHCVNSLSMRFIPAFTKEGLEIATFAGGCFWGVEYLLKSLKGVKSVTSGYMGGHVVNPTYQEVSSHVTGHLEAVTIFFDPEVILYKELLKAFFEIHDFTQKDGQGPDIGPQYLSKVFVYSHKQLKDTQEVIEALKKKGFKVATTIEYATVFYPAEAYHQNYYEKHQKMPYCHKRRAIF